MSKLIYWKLGKPYLIAIILCKPVNYLLYLKQAVYIWFFISCFHTVIKKRLSYKIQIHNIQFIYYHQLTYGKINLIYFYIAFAFNSKRSLRISKFISKSQIHRSDISSIAFYKNRLLGYMTYVPRLIHQKRKKYRMLL